MKAIKKIHTKHKIFASYVVIPALLLTVISGLFTFRYYRMSRERTLAFETTISENVNEQLKNVMDNLLSSAVQYSMTPWVRRLKYMQKTPELMRNRISASDVSDYASTISLTEINDSIVESICIYYGLGDFGISGSGRVTWKEYMDVYGISAEDESLLLGAVLRQNNQKRIFHHVTMNRNGKRTDGFFLIQTIPLENTFNGEVNLLFYVPYENICSYLSKFMDGGTREFYLTDGLQALYGYTEAGGGPGAEISGSETEVDAGPDEHSQKTEAGAEDSVRSPESGYVWSERLNAYVSEYVKVGMDIGIIQILDNDFIYRDFFSFLRWIITGYFLLFGLILLVSSRLTKRSYEPLEQIMNLIDEKADNEADEYMLIERALREFNTQKERLDVSRYEQNPMIEQYLLHGLLGGNHLKPDEADYINTMRQYAKYRCLVLHESLDARPCIGEVDACLAVYPQVHAVFLKEEKHYVWILSYGEESLMEEIAEILSQTFDELDYREAALALGGAHEDIRDLPDAYEEAVRALAYHFFYPGQRLIWYDLHRIGLHAGQEFELRDSDLARMQEAAEALDADTALDAYRAVLRYNFYDRMLEADAWFAGVHRLYEMFAGMFPETEQGNVLEQMGILEPESFSSLDSYLQTFGTRTANLMERCRVRENPVYAARNQVIRQYVEEHLTDANLSLNETARVMHYTSTYFGKYFKEQFGCAFQQYVAVRRIESAKEYLLADPDRKKMSIQDIALKCGFTNDVTFRRTFKRYTGVNPSQFTERIQEA